MKVIDNLRPHRRRRQDRAEIARESRAWQINATEAEEIFLEIERGRMRQAKAILAVVAEGIEQEPMQAAKLIQIGNYIHGIREEIARLEQAIVRRKAHRKEAEAETFEYGSLTDDYFDSEDPFYTLEDQRRQGKE